MRPTKLSTAPVVVPYPSIEP